ncbi:MAG: lysophospholipid acyltransferase family protein [Hyphomonadaceae bacterium]|jgi:1-acyl-sn-glycerol-3-phosphate acyltransferase|uniref:lysophospholipid acyltransferase family protein n=1 Tax=Aquidulcibacter sp. TaxID=2052990 RepID=UPI0022CCFA00|nr:lysophospholipid acyltransferase family protein [Aquidulcibacter sp.]MCZ8207770.1 lysophospholipid acyltransferase family protein [Aquidulcibacter sp.]
MTLIRSFLLMLWMWGSVLIVGTLGAPYVFLSPLGGARVMETWAKVMRFGAKWIAGITYEVRGLEHLPNGPIMIGAKHQSVLDTIIPTLFTNMPVYVLKQELLNLPIFGWYCRKAGLIAIDRSGHMSALKAMVAQAKERFEQGRPLIIFPEGTRQMIGAEPDYKPGVAAIYMLLGVPCVPLALNTGTSWPAKGFMRYPGKVVFEFLPVIPPGLKRGPFMELLESRIEGASQALLEEHYDQISARESRKKKDNDGGDGGGSAGPVDSNGDQKSSGKTGKGDEAEFDWKAYGERARESNGMGDRDFDGGGGGDGGGGDGGGGGGD